MGHSSNAVVRGNSKFAAGFIPTAVVCVYVRKYSVQIMVNQDGINVVLVGIAENNEFAALVVGISMCDSALGRRDSPSPSPRVQLTRTCEIEWDKAPRLISIKESLPQTGLKQRELTPAVVL